MAKETISQTEGLCKEVAMCVRNAYERGYKQGFKDGNYDKEFFCNLNFEHGTYKGLDLAWECARKIVGDVVEPHFESGYMVDIFGCESAITAMTNNSASEAIAKIKEYEEKQKADSNKVTRQSIIKSQLMDIVNGQKNPVTADEIAEVLEQLKGE